MITEGLEQCTRMLDGSYAGRSLSVRVTARLYALRAKLHCLRSNFLMADADWGYSLCLDPFQHQVRRLADCAASSPLHPHSRAPCNTSLHTDYYCSMLSHQMLCQDAQRVCILPHLDGCLFHSVQAVFILAVELHSKDRASTSTGHDTWPARMVAQCRLSGVLPACPHSVCQCSAAGSGGVAAEVTLCSCLPGCIVRHIPGQPGTSRLPPLL